MRGEGPSSDNIEAQGEARITPEEWKPDQLPRLQTAGLSGRPIECIVAITDNVTGDAVAFPLRPSWRPPRR